MRNNDQFYSIGRNTRTILHNLRKDMCNKYHDGRWGRELKGADQEIPRSATSLKSKIKRLVLTQCVPLTSCKNCSFHAVHNAPMKTFKLASPFMETVLYGIKNDASPLSNTTFEGVAFRL